MTLTGPTPKTPAGWARKVPPVLTLTSMSVEGIEGGCRQGLEWLGSGLVEVGFHLAHWLLVHPGWVVDDVAIHPDGDHCCLGREEGDPDFLHWLPRALADLSDPDQLCHIPRQLVVVEEIFPVLGLRVLAVLQGWKFVLFLTNKLYRILIEFDLTEYCIVNF